MAIALSEIIAARDRLIEARLNGTRRYKDSNGEEVEYKTDAEMARALAAAESMIADAHRGRPVTTIHFQTSKGL